MSVLRRLERLEESEGLDPASQARQRHAAVEHILDRAAPVLAAYTVLAETMDPDDVARVELAIVDSFRWVRVSSLSVPELWFTPGHRGDDPLVENVLRLCRDGAYGRHRGPFELPHAVAAEYVKPSMYIGNQCSECGYSLLRVFDRCPLCGGEVGESGVYSRRHGREPPRFRLPPALVEEWRGRLYPIVEAWLIEGPGNEGETDDNDS